MAITQVDSLEHDTTAGLGNSLVMIDATHFILAYSGVGTDGFIKTFSIDGSYGSITEIDSLEHDIARGLEHSLAMIDSTHFVCAYSGVLSDGFVKTLSIDGSYNITEIESLEYDLVQGNDVSVAVFDSTHFVIAHEGEAGDGYVRVFTIDGSYSNITEVANLEHDILDGHYNSVKVIDSTHFILAYTGAGGDGYIKTFSVDRGGASITEIDSNEFNTSTGQHNSMIEMATNSYIIAHAGAGTDGHIQAITIDGSYNITLGDLLEHDTALGTYNSLVKIDDDHFALAYAGVGSDGYIKTFSFFGGTIVELDSLEHDTVQGIWNSIGLIDSNAVVLAHAGDGSDGFIRTFTLGFGEIVFIPKTVFF